MRMRRCTGPRRWDEIACRWDRDKERGCPGHLRCRGRDVYTGASQGETNEQKISLQLANLFRAESDQQNFFPLMLGAHVILSGAFVWIYARGVEARPWLAQGLRFGVAVALLTIVPTYLIYFAVQPM